MNFEVKRLAKTEKKITVTVDRLIIVSWLLKFLVIFCVAVNPLSEISMSSKYEHSIEIRKIVCFIEIKLTLTMNIFNGSFTPMQFKIKSIDNLQTYSTYM